mmetsp:Transcript_11940/g.19798  ORF Transcript_11940/g.19798 Transcript_11940/m.19798 type:complete len:221 (-) Transcript_11940:74-736(-)
MTNYQAISTSEAEKGEIMCPFIKMINPNTRNLWTFARDFKQNGVGWTFTLFFTFIITFLQRGWWRALLGYSPDIYKLKEVPMISHTDLYINYFPEVNRRVEDATDGDGMITLQLLVDIKKWIAEQEATKLEKLLEESNLKTLVDYKYWIAKKEGIPLNRIIDSSKIETVLVFLGAGGNTSTKKVMASSVLKFMQGERSGNAIKVDIWRVHVLYQWGGLQW